MASIKRGGKVSEEILKESVQEGFLSKQGALNRKWRNRYFILSKDHRLLWSKRNGEGEAIKGELNSLEDYKVVKTESFSSLEFKLCPKEEKGRVFYLRASCEQERNSWIESLTAASYRFSLKSSDSPLNPFLSLSISSSDSSSNIPILRKTSSGNESNRGSVSPSHSSGDSSSSSPPLDPFLSSPSDSKSDREICFKSEELIDPPQDFCDPKLGSELAIVPKEWHKQLVGVRKVVGIKEEAKFFELVSYFSSFKSLGISSIYGYSIVDDTYALIVDYPVGRTLSQFTMHDPLRIFEVCLMISTTINQLHDHSIFHYNLRPNNIFVNEIRKQIVNVVIHEIAVCKLPPSPQGDPRNNIYIPPELQEIEEEEREKEIEENPTKADVFAFGMIVWEMFARNPAWLNEEMIPTESISSKLKEGKRPQIPERCFLAELIESCWSQNPNDRPSFQQIQSSLLQIKNSEQFASLRSTIERTMSTRGSFQRDFLSTSSSSLNPSPRFERKDGKTTQNHF